MLSFIFKDCVSTREETRQQIQTMFQSQLKCLLSSKLFTDCKLQQFPIPKAPSRTQRMQRVWRCQASHVHTPASLTTLNLPGPTLGAALSLKAMALFAKCVCVDNVRSSANKHSEWTSSFFIHLLQFLKVFPNSYCFFICRYLLSSWKPFQIFDLIHSHRPTSIISRFECSQTFGCINYSRYPKKHL